MKSWSIGLIGLLGLITLIGSSFRPQPVMLAVAIVFAGLIGFGWPHYLRVPAKKTLAAVIVVSGSLAAVAASYAPAPGFLDWVPAIIAVGVCAVFVVELVRGTGQLKRLESTLGASAGVLLACLGSGWIAAERFNGPSDMMLVACVSAASAILVGLIRWPDRIVAPLGTALAGLAGPLGGMLSTDVPWVPAMVIGLVIGAVLTSFRRLVSLGGETRSYWVGLTLGLAPVFGLGALIYFVDKLLLRS